MLNSYILTQNHLYKDQIRDIFLNKKTFIIGPKKSGKSYITKYIIDILNHEFDYLCEIYENPSDLIDTDAYIYNTISKHPSSVIESIIKKSNTVNRLFVLFNVKTPEEYIETICFTQLMSIENITLFFYSDYPIQSVYPRYNIILTKNLDVSSYPTYIATYFNSDSIKNNIHHKYFNLKNHEYIVIDNYKHKYHHILNTPKKDDLADLLDYTPITSSLSLYSLVIAHRTGGWRTFIPYIKEKVEIDDLP